MSHYSFPHVCDEHVEENKVKCSALFCATLY